jgi:Ca-activated chloride channel family protein
MLSIRVCLGKFGWRTAALFLLAGLGGCESSATPVSIAQAAAEAQEPAPDPNSVQLLFTYGSEKEEWIKDVTAAFNASQQKAGGKTIVVKATPMGSGECIDEVIRGVRKPHLISPASAAFIQLGNAESKEKNGTALVGPTKNLVLSPVVIAMWKPMAEALGWGKKPVGWADIRDIANAADGWVGRGHADWGSFKFGHTHPDFSNSGLISIFAEIYAATGKNENITPEDVRSPKTAQFLHDIEKSVLHYGSSTGFFGKKMFANGPQFLSAAVLYENMVIESYGKEYQDKLPFPVVAVYPKEGTFWSDHPVGVVQRDWVTDEHKQAARIYIDYLLTKEAQQKAMTYGFRPGLESLTLTTPLDADHGVDPREPKLVLDAPSVEVMQAARKAWQQNKKHARVVLVFDRSGSMNSAGKLNNAKRGARDIIAMLGDDDTLGLLPFSSTSAWIEKGVKMKDGRERMVSAVNGIFAEGETALYDTIAQAYEFIQANPEPELINAIIVLTDGEDNKSRLKLKELVGKVKIDNEKKNVRIYTIAYAADSREADIYDRILKLIADATQAKSYKGTPENIRAVFKDIATFF